MIDTPSTDADKIRQITTLKLMQSRLIAIIRLKKQAQVKSVVRCLAAGGVRALEVTANTPGYCEEITLAREAHPNILVGAGTITTGTLALQAIQAGAQFLVTPNTSKQVVDVAHAHNIPVLMGALTPTEIADALEYGADIVKLFPAGTMGIPYYKSITGPFDKVPIMPVGGIGLHNIEQWLAAGVAGVGVGNDLTSAVDTDEDRSALIELAKKYVAIATKSKAL